MKELFRNRVFLIIASVDLIQQLGIWVRNMALLFYVMDQTGDDPVAVSLLTVFEYLPIFVFSMIGGTLADRWNPKRTMIAGDALSAVSIAVILAFIEAGWWQAVFAATIVSAVVSQFSQPSSSIMFKRHVPEELVPAAIGITQSLMSLFVIVGPMIGTAVYAWLGVSTSLLILIVAFAAAALIQLALPAYVREKRPEDSSVWSELVMGLRYVRGHRNLLLITATFALIGLGSGLIQPLDIFLITERLGLDKEDLKWFYALAGIGMLAGGGAAAVFGRKASPRIVVASAVVFLSASIVIEALSVWVGLTATMRFLVGGAFTFMQIVLGTALISMVAEAFIGRVNGTIVPVMMAGMLTGSGLSGFFMKAMGLVPTYIIAAAIVLLAAPIALRMKIARPDAPEQSQPLSQGETAVADR
ncbi:MFS transporter [Paenibacillus aurantiacus]|uniref:MFS transporter n=1 Tax=Paenibacillus aurantiacus TaxID=1936118 RepID=A0ABV5KM13_9BACL